MDAPHAPHANDVHEEVQQEDDCPICYGELGNPEPLCPNGHKVCDACRPQMLDPRHVFNRRGIRCPICRATIHWRPAGGGPAPAGGGLPAWMNMADDHLLDLRVGLARDAIGRVHHDRPELGGEWNEARRRFLANREAGRIPPDASFGGIHHRCCGVRQCLRQGGDMGVRFLLWRDTGKRRYRCEEHQHD